MKSLIKRFDEQKEFIVYAYIGESSCRITQHLLNFSSLLYLCKTEIGIHLGPVYKVSFETICKSY
mgnify:FL=1